VEKTAEIDRICCIKFKRRREKTGSVEDATQMAKKKGISRHLIRMAMINISKECERHNKEVEDKTEFAEIDHVTDIHKGSILLRSGYFEAKFSILP
jgi:SOS response regulatory protein OraA/RecX